MVSFRSKRSVRTWWTKLSCLDKDGMLQYFPVEPSIMHILRANFTLCLYILPMGSGSTYAHAHLYYLRSFSFVLPKLSSTNSLLAIQLHKHVSDARTVANILWSAIERVSCVSELVIGSIVCCVMSWCVVLRYVMVCYVTLRYGMVWYVV